MSNKLRNPFKVRASEKIESDASFLRLFSPVIIEDLVKKHESQKLWNNVLFVRSSPGGGKTSLLRIFEPNSLSTLFNNKSATDFKELFSLLKKIDAVNNKRIKVLGVALTCTGNYDLLDELNIPDVNKKRLFYSLLNSRIVISILRAVLQLKQASFPEDLDKITFEYKNEDNYYTSLNVPCSGVELFNWAANIERSIFQAIDSFLPIENLQVEGHNELFSLFTVESNTLRYDGENIADRFLVMLDDAHKLSIGQRESLIKHVVEKRGNFSVWISERLEALDSKDSFRSYKERDYEELNIEKFWSESPKKLDHLLQNISNKRASISTEDVTSFQEYLEADINEEELKNSIYHEGEITQKTLLELTAPNDTYSDWIDYVKNYEGTALEKVLLAKKVEILIHRTNGKKQLTLQFPHTKSELEDKLKYDVESAARLFITKNSGIPYYYGFSSLSKLSSNNIEQFLSFAAPLFEQMVSNKISGANISLSASKQDQIIRSTVEGKWKELNRLLPYSKEVIKFLNGLGKYCNTETYKLNAPYAPGVNGFSIKLRGEQLLLREADWLHESLFAPLVNVISTCLAYNLLESREVAQGEKGQKWTVYYLNRWLCVKYNLPLNYGGFRHKSPDDLLKWTKK